MQSARHGGGRRTQDWVDSEYMYGACAVTPAEMEAALKAARKDLLRDKRPVPRGSAPHLIITIGAPGAGKSTVAEAVARRGDHGDYGDYVTIDEDVAVKYHPRYAGVWGVPSAVTGRPTGVGFTMGYLMCNQHLLGGVMVRIFEELVHAKGPRYNIILQSHAQDNLIEAKLEGYRTTLLFVGVPLPVAIRRSRDRAIATGKFLAPTLAAQDEIVDSMWNLYRRSAAWYGLWADEFLVADNSRPARDPAAFATDKRLVAIPLHGEPWEARLAAAQAAIDAACGV